MRPAIVSGMVIVAAPFSYLLFFSIFVRDIPEFVAKVNLAQSPSRFQSGEWSNLQSLTQTVSL